MEPVLYLRSYNRRPVRRYPRWDLHDVQGEIPAGWCCRCGREIYRYPTWEGDSCDVCKKRRKENGRKKIV